MNDIIKSVIFGVIEGITEWLPVSSTGHLIIAERFISFGGVSDGFYEAYSVLIQLSAVMSVMTVFFKRLFPFDFHKGEKMFKRDIFIFDLKTAVGCVPAAITGILLNDFIEEKFYSCEIVAFSLIIYGILFIIIERAKKDSQNRIDTAEEISFKGAFSVGLFQMLSLIPGTSRSGSTVMGGMITGMSRASAAEFSFFMAIPVMAGASAVKIISADFAFSFYEIAVLFIGAVTSFVVSMLTVERLVDFVKKHTFIPFGIYRIFLGLILLIFNF